jgi:hypothetical protein
MVGWSVILGDAKVVILQRVPGGVRGRGEVVYSIRNEFQVSGNKESRYAEATTDWKLMAAPPVPRMRQAMLTYELGY